MYLNLSHNAFEGALPLAALSPHSAGETAGSSRGSSDSGAASEERRNTRERRIEAAAGMASSPLSYANLSNNKFTGRVSGEVGTLTSLETLDLSHNKLEGEIPRDIGNCVSLRVLSFSRCGLSGRLDGNSGEEFGRLRLLETLRLDGNTLEGTVPASFGNLTHLEVLQLQVCLLVCLFVLAGPRSCHGSIRRKARWVWVPRVPHTLQNIDEQELHLFRIRIAHVLLVPWVKSAAASCRIRFATE